MRRYDDRYAHDMRRHDLALRLIGYEVRTQTIARLTGLGDKRIRALYRTYYRDGSDRQTRRHRGPAPQRASSLLESPALRSEAAAVSGLLLMFGVIQIQPRKQSQITTGLPAGELLCRAFELYRSLVPDARIDLEHVMLLATSLSRGEEIALEQCERCGGVILIDLAEVERRVCAHCRREVGRREIKQHSARARERDREVLHKAVVRETTTLPGFQHRLFDGALSAENSHQGVVASK
jgi:hypothetical protein